MSIGHAPLARIALLTGCAVLAVLFADEAAAQAAENNTTLGILDRLSQDMRAAQGAIQGTLYTTFWLLASIELAFALIMVALHEQGLPGLVRELAIRTLFIGFFLALLQNGVGWTDAIIATMAEIGADVTGMGVQSLAPDRIIDTGLTMMRESLFAFSLWEAGTSMVLLVAATITFLALMLIAANLALLLVEFYIVGYGGIVLLALGGSRWTSGYAIAYLKYTLAMGMRFLIFYVLVGIGYSAIMAQVDAGVRDNANQLWALAAMSVVLAIVASRAPNAVTGLLQGVSTSATISLGQAARTTAATAWLATGGASSAVGSSAALAQAVRLGSAQSGNTAINSVTSLGKAALNEVKGWMGGAGAGNVAGSVFPRGGTTGGRMATDMAKQREAIVKGKKR